MATILIPSKGPDDWKRFLASEGHWKPGFSARALAHSWEGSRGFPPEIAELLATSPAFGGADLLLAIPEHKVSLPGGGRQSQTDLWALASTASGLVSIAVEGKVAEPFGPSVGEWLRDASQGKTRRLAFLRELLHLPDPVPADLRYQLLHRAASAILEARRFHAAHAVLAVHSFSPSDAWLEEFERFGAALGASATKGALAQVLSHTTPTLHLGWARGDARFLTA